MSKFGRTCPMSFPQIRRVLNFQFMEDRPRQVWSPFEYLLREDPALKCLVVVWVCAAAMVALDIPIALTTHTGVQLPGVTVAAAALGTLGIMVRFRKSAKPEARSSEVEMELRQRVAELEARIANLEVIDRFEHHLAEKTVAARQGSTSANGIGAGMNRPGRESAPRVAE